MTTNEKKPAQRIATVAAARAQEMGTKLGLLPGAWLGDLIPVFERLLTLEHAEEQRANACTNPDCRTCFEYVGRARSTEAADPLETTRAAHQLI